MKLSTSAGLISAFVCPGGGYFIVEQQLRGIIAVTITVLYLTFFFFDIAVRSDGILQKIAIGEIAYTDLLAISRYLISATGSVSDAIFMKITYAFAFVWLVTIVDSYHIGRSLENQNK